MGKNFDIVNPIMSNGQRIGFCPWKSHPHLVNPSHWQTPLLITQEDLLRSDVTNIPDALRMVPDVTVAKIDSSKWADLIR